MSNQETEDMELKELLANAHKEIEGLREQLSCALNDGFDTAKREFDKDRRELDEEIEQQDQALQVAYVALGDWVCEYAGELCNKDRVAEASERIHENGGLYYIGNAQSIVHKALNK